MGSPDKLAEPLGATTVLGGLLARVPPGVPVVLVGPARGAAAGDRPGALTAREDPPHGGPAAAVAAGVAALDAAGLLAPAPGGADVVAVCAGDAPWSPVAVPALVAALRPAAGGVVAAVAVDAAGVRQPLLAAHRLEALRARLGAAGDLAGRAAGWLLGGPVVEVAAPAGAADDVDTPEQLALARERAARE